MRLARLLPLLFLLAAPRPAAAADPAPLTVFAAASLTNALARIDALWESAGHPAPRAAFGGSGALARQITAGAPADVFISADTRWMDALAAHGLLLAGTRETIAGNALVLVVPAAGARPVALARGTSLLPVLGPDGRLAIGNVRSVPAGIYGAEALHALGLWDAVAGRLAQTTDVRAALLAVQNGAAAAAIVYRSDARGAAGVTVAGTFPPGSHTPITYPAAAIANTHAPDAARAFLALLRSPAAQAILVGAGFSAVASLPDPNR